MDNPEKLPTLGTQDTGQINVREYRRDNKKGQSRETANIGYTRHRMKTMSCVPKKNSIETYNMQSMGKNILMNFLQINAVIYSHDVYIKYVYGY